MKCATALSCVYPTRSRVDKKIYLCICAVRPAHQTTPKQPASSWSGFVPIKYATFQLMCLKRAAQLLRESGSYTVKYLSLPRSFLWRRCSSLELIKIIQMPVPFPTGQFAMCTAGGLHSFELEKCSMNGVPGGAPTDMKRTDRPVSSYVICHVPNIRSFMQSRNGTPNESYVDIYLYMYTNL